MTTKAKDGHDEPVEAHVFYDKYGKEPARTCLDIFETGRKVAAQHGFVIADTKFELSTGHIIADEVLTPDSSRFIRVNDLLWAQRTGVKPPSYDKQGIRDWAEEEFGLGPKIELTPELVARVQKTPVPAEVTEDMGERYLKLLHTLTGAMPKDLIE